MAPLTAGITEEILPALSTTLPLDNAADFLSYLREQGYDDDISIIGLPIADLPDHLRTEVVGGVAYAIIAIIAVNRDRFLLGISNPHPARPQTAEHELRLFRRFVSSDANKFVYGK